MNEAKLSKLQLDRLHHWQIAHRSVKHSDLNDNCPVCAEGKKKTGSFKRNVEFVEHYRENKAILEAICRWIRRTKIYGRGYVVPRRDWRLCVRLPDRGD